MKIRLAIQILNHALIKLGVLAHHEILFSLEVVHHGFKHSRLRELVFQVNGLEFIANIIVVWLV